MLTGVPVSQANDLLGASYRVYQHAETKDRIIRTVGYAIPAVLHGHVQTVAPTTYFGPLRPQGQTLRKRSGGAAAALAKAASVSREPVKVLSSRSSDITPSELRYRYNMLGYGPAATDENKLGLVGYHGDYPSQSDLVKFMEEYRRDGEAAFTFVRVGGGDNPDGPSAEANLDIQYGVALTYPTPNIYYSTSSEGVFLKWLDYILNEQDIPQTITTSYAGNEQDFPEDYAISMCLLFARLGVRGVSVIFSGGDYGVGRGDCVVNDGSGKVQFLPIFPATCTCSVFFSVHKWYKFFIVLPRFNRSLGH